MGVASLGGGQVEVLGVLLFGGGGRGGTVGWLVGGGWMSG